MPARVVQAEQRSIHNVTQQSTTATCFDRTAHSKTTVDRQETRNGRQTETVHHNPSCVETRQRPIAAGLSRRAKTES